VKAVVIRKSSRVFLMWYIAAVFVILGLFIAGGAFAHSAGGGDHYATPQPEDRAPTAEEEKLIACGTIGVHAAWGAEAELRGAPAVMKLAPMLTIKSMFFGESSVPADGIYIAEELSERARQDYFVDTLVGYAQAQTGMFDGGWTHEMLTAYFYNACKTGEL